MGARPPNFCLRFNEKAKLFPFQHNSKNSLVTIVKKSEAGYDIKLFKVKLCHY